MSRSTHTTDDVMRQDEDSAPHPDDPEVLGHEEEFWGADALSKRENSDALARILEEEQDEDAAARATRSYMGTAAGGEEREQLAQWAESKACRACRRKLATVHDPGQLRHEGCRSALRAARLLGRES